MVNLKRVVSHSFTNKSHAGMSKKLLVWQYTQYMQYFLCAAAYILYNPSYPGTLGPEDAHNFEIACICETDFMHPLTCNKTHYEPETHMRL